MKQHTKTQSLIYHLYPGVLITLFFCFATPLLIDQGLPPQFTMLLAIIIIVVPVMLLHLHLAAKREKVARISALIGNRKSLSAKQLILYSSGLTFFAFIIYGIIQPLNVLLEAKLFFWLPDWYQVRDFSGYSRKIILLTLGMNLVFNGLIAPIVEEVYFRGYLMPRMSVWGKYVPLLSALLFSLYHFWQPQIYLTLFIALLPMTCLVWKTKSLMLAIYTHCSLNILGALLSFGMLYQ